MRRSRCSDAGQAFPIYITVVGGLLFLALAFFAVGQASANRNGAQTASDAAALAAAQDSRDQLAAMWLGSIQDPSKWQEIFSGDVAGLEPSCWRAQQLAARNEAKVVSCAPEGLLGFTVEVETTKSVGDSIVPGTEDKRSLAVATAVIEPRCTFELPTGNAAGDSLPQLACEGALWDLDPENLDDLPTADELFDVHLAD
ncbi:pilus assembly protein TadG-related protein [Streptomyces sp. ZSW22]|uniref:pilus assembly protein TadG-related protein n=1 Tax=Streptomyces sp. ZSW22 TaxID=3055050 RepID=UPI0025B0ADC6|nr:pilus assembly protein TadG-related protein [Streptomyces sp. ZSW22]MDN3247641.1 pilus assembly protein TadG-related protein [Streptomyces sp. ZSW22]